MSADKIIEVVAQAICVNQENGKWVPADWENAGELDRDYYRAQAAIAIAMFREALNGGQPAAEPCPLGFDALHSMLCSAGTCHICLVRRCKALTEEVERLRNVLAKPA